MLKGHSGRVESVVFSHDSCRLASASDDKTVKVWDARTGLCLQTLQGHSGRVRSAVFSHDSRQLVSVSDDETVKVWDATTGQCLQTLEGHSCCVNSVVFSHDSCRLALALEDKTVKLWDAMTGQCLQTLEGHSGRVRSVVFSHDSCRLASASDDETVKLWDATTGQCLQTLDTGRMVSHIEFSEQGDCLYTNVGTFAILPPASEQVSSLSYIPIPRSSSNGQRRGYGLSADGAWILFDDEKRLWLPPEYRPTTAAVDKEGRIAIGCASGRVLQWAF
ncbi:COMPASS component SWD3 [Microdochium nivale]|nr:COMPASS component SWD3 [Microdochium nivale]